MICAELLTLETLKVSLWQIGLTYYLKRQACSPKVHDQKHADLAEQIRSLR